MTIHSMTGYGEAEVCAAGWTMTVQCRSVNHRGLDVRVWSPRDWAWVEPFALEQARAVLNRGRVEVRVECTPDDDATVSSVVAPAMFQQVARELREQAEQAGLAEPTVSDVLMFDQVRVRASGAVIPDDNAPFEAAIERAIKALSASRAEEGARLVSTMTGLLTEVADAVGIVAAAAQTVGDEYRTRLQVRMQDALSKFGASELDERALLQEVALYADRSDVSEELQRTQSHIEKLRGVFATEQPGAVGKQVDFYLQELFREANTTGSKSGSVAITEQVIVMKTAIEQMREQAANIE